MRNPGRGGTLLDPLRGKALIEGVPREIPDKGLRNRWPDGSAEIL
jgi:hypothetical protein